MPPLIRLDLNDASTFSPHGEDAQQPTARSRAFGCLCATVSLLRCAAVKTKGIPSNSQDVIQAHASAIEDYVHNHVGLDESGNPGRMYFNRTLEDWIGFKIDKRTKFDLSISSGLALLAAQKVKPKKPPANFEDRVFFRRYKPR